MSQTFRILTRALVALPVLSMLVTGCTEDTATPPNNLAPAKEFPDAEIAGTPETDSLADAPAQCGQDDFVWNHDLDVGKVTNLQTKNFYAKGILEALVNENLGTLPYPLQYDVRNHVVTYVTQDRGVEVEATALISWPTNVPPEAEALPTLVFLHGTSGFTDGCGPSGSTEDGVLAAALASLGYVVVAPDYIGLKNDSPSTGFLHPYLAGQPTAIASFDAIRTLGHLPDELREGDARVSNRVVVVGGSQGGHAALWFDRLAPYYARELEIAGIAATVPPADLVGQTKLGLSTYRDSTANVAAFYGATSQWYGHQDKLSEVFRSPIEKELPIALGASCDPGIVLDILTTLELIFQPEFLSAAATFPNLNPWGCMATENGLTTTSIPRIQKDSASYGILFITGESDTLVDTPTERASFETLCNAGMPMQYLECAGASHTQATAWAIPEILTFLHERLEGKEFVKQCTAGAPTTCSATK